MNTSEEESVYARFEPALDACCKSWKQELEKLDKSFHREINKKFQASFRSLYDQRQCMLNALNNAKQ